MTKARLVVASALLAVAAVATPVAVGTLHSEHSVRGQDIGWGTVAASTTDESTTELTATTSSTDTTNSDIGWG